MHLFLQKRIRAQPSERWAMYRLICPVVDAACEMSGLEPFFEYSQPNGPNRRLSADIALIQSGQEEPVWLIEAKKFGRLVNPGMISPYLSSGAMGVVTNGNEWIFLVSGSYLNVGPLVGPDHHVDQSIYRQLVSILAATEQSDAYGRSNAWASAWQASARTALPPIWRANGGRGTRSYHEKTRYETLQEAAVAARAYVQNGTVPANLLDEIETSGVQANVGHFEINQARMIWWLGTMRLARLNLVGRQMELLVHNALLEGEFRSTIRASIKMHDKNTNMSVLKASTPEELVGLVALFGRPVAT